MKYWNPWRLYKLKIIAIPFGLATILIWFAWNKIFESSFPASYYTNPWYIRYLMPLMATGFFILFGLLMYCEEKPPPFDRDRRIALETVMLLRGVGDQEGAKIVANTYGVTEGMYEKYLLWRNHPEEYEAIREVWK